jgi:hypothetical protein
MAWISSVADKIGNFSQGTVNNIFLKITDIDGFPRSAETVSITITHDSSSAVVVNNVNATTVSDGYYFYEWSVDADASVGMYNIVWSYVYEDVEYSVQQTAVVSEMPDDHSMYYGVVADLRTALEFHIRPVMNIPVYFEQARPSRDRQNFKFSFPRWNQGAGVRVYLNKEIVQAGVGVDYFMGRVTFAEPLTEYDTVYADYNFRWFDDRQIVRFLNNGLARYNYYPPYSNHTLQTMPHRAIMPTLYGAAVDALREIMLSLSMQEPSLVFGGPEKVQNIHSQIDTLKKNFEEDLNKMFEQKKFGPYTGLTRMVVVPEYTLPGGRSRWFRYMFTGSNT